MKRLLPAYTKSPAVYFFIKLSLFSIAIAAAFHTSAQSADQQQQETYKKAITERSAKIVNSLSIKDSVKYKQLVSVIEDQYFVLNAIQQKNEAAVATIKKDTSDKEKQTAALKSQEEKKSSEIMQLHNGFVAQLKVRLTEEQVDKVKDGMTYNVFPLTNKAYQDMIPSLTATQKEKIYNWLKEARELAMDAGSAEKKHAVFGKYKGRINNYLSAEGYDVKKEGEEWAKRIQVAKESKQNQN